jgi:hypothetical protein
MHFADGSFGSFGGVRLVPPALVGAARALLQAQGIDPNVLSASGEVDAGALIALGFDTVELRTAMTPPLRINLKEPSDPETSALLNQIRPTIIFSGRAGRYELAPYGQTSGAAGVVGTSQKNLLFGVGAAVLGLVLMLKR